MISKEEADKRIGAIEALEKHAAHINQEIYNRKSNLLQTYYGFEISPYNIDIDKQWSYTDFTYTREDQVFCDIDDALEYARANPNKEE